MSAAGPGLRPAVLCIALASALLLVACGDGGSAAGSGELKVVATTAIQHL